MIRVKNRIVFSFFLGFVLTSTMAIPPSGMAAGSVLLLPETPAPVIDGNVTTLEWTNSARFEATLDQIQASVFVTTNESNIFFAINFTQPKFLELNMTAPVNATNFNPGLNRTHDFMAVQIDNNFDKLNLGSNTSRDDVVVINRYENVSRDAYTDGNATSVFNLDTANNGTNDGNAKYLVVNGTTDQVSYEFTKDMSSTDRNGSDFNVNISRGVQFRFLSWFNQTANATFDKAVPTDWFTLRMNSTGGLSSVEQVSSTPVTFDFFGLSASDENTIRNTLKFSGYSLTDFASVNVSKYEKSINGTLVFIIGNGEIDKTKADAALSYVRSGGTAIFLLSGVSDQSTKFSSMIAEGFGLKFEGKQLLTSNNSLDISASDLGSMDYLTGPSVITNDAVTKMSGKGYVLNASQLHENSLILDQKYMDYQIIGLPSGTYIDENGNGLIGTNEVMTTSATLAVGFDFLKGGRAVVSSFNPLLADDVLTAGNVPFFFRTLAWVSKQTQALVGHSSEVSNTHITQNDKITVSANVSDLFGVSLKDNLEISVLLTRGGSPIARSSLLEVDGFYSSEFKVDSFGWLDFRISGNASQYGFVQFKTVSVLAERHYQGFNTDKNLLMIGIGLGSSLALIYLTYRKISSFQ